MPVLPAIFGPPSPAPAGPHVVIVSLQDQTFHLYNREGLARATPVSTGLADFATPPGIYSILEKRKEHWSNIYDAEMPNMQRLTWTGIALHEGKVTGRPASHGCVRLPAEFAEDLFSYTKTGMRVIISPRKAEPVAIAHDALFAPRRVMADATLNGALKPTPAVANGGEAPALITASAPTGGTAADRPEQKLAERRAARERARVAARQEEDARKAATVPLAEVARLSKLIDDAARNVRAAERALQAATRAVDAAAAGAGQDKLDVARQAAVSKVTEADQRHADAQAVLKRMRDASANLLEPVRFAEEAAKSTWEAYRQLVRQGEPVSVFVSAKSGVLQVRQAFDPIFESPVSITDRGGKPLGTHVFTAMDIVDGDGPAERVARWTVITIPVSTPAALAPPADASVKPAADVSALVNANADVTPPSAHEALDRISIPQDVRQRIAALLVPGSSLIVSDEGPSVMMGKGTDFIVELK